MPHELPRSRIVESLAASVASFAECQSAEGLASLIGFFHLAVPHREARIELIVSPSGRLELSIDLHPVEEGG